MEKIKLSVADGSTIIGSWGIPVYYTLYFGRENLQEMFKEAEVEADFSVFEQLHSIKQGQHGIIIQEHFIIHHTGEQQYSIEDRNSPSLTYLNNKQVSKTPIPLHPGDVITIPLVHNNAAESCFIQFDLLLDEPSGSTVKQLFQCSRSGDRFIVYWEEEPNARKHFATHTEKVPKTTQPPAKSEFKNIRPASEVLCPYCGNLQIGICPKCKLYICMGNETDVMKCAGCNTKYKLRDVVKSNDDIKTI